MNKLTDCTANLSGLGQSDNVLSSQRVRCDTENVRKKPHSEVRNGRKQSVL